LETKNVSKELKDRFHEFARRVSDFFGKLKWELISTEYIKHPIKASGSFGANYIEASDDLEKADENMKTKLHEEKRKNLSSLAFLLTPPFSLVPSLCLVP
jgi:hypothetical protein